MKWLWRWLFGCKHKHISFPAKCKGQTERVVCQDCDRILLYDWEQMKVLD